MRFIITTIGSHGDIHPYVGVGQALRRRGHDVAFLAQPYFKGVAEDAGLEFVPVGEFLDLREIANRPELMGSWTGTKRILQEMIIPQSATFFRTLEAEFARRRPHAVFTHHICFGVTWACRKHEVPVAVGCLAPLAWASPEDPAHFTPITNRDPCPAAMKFWLRLARFASGLSYDPPLNRIRRELGLPRRDSFFVDELRGGEINLGLWSQHFRRAFPSDPEHGHICGFVWFDRHKQQEHATADLERFLDAGDPPVIFTLGTTAVHVAGPFYQAAAEACRMLGRRGMLLTGHADYAPRDLPAGVQAFTYAPYTTVLPRGCATVHHGGIGTTAQSMRAGRPSVVVPFAHDQFDNAARLRRLGVSATVKRARLSAAKLAAALGSVLDDPNPARRALAMGRALNAECGEDVAAAKLEAFAVGAATGSLLKTG